MKHTSDFYANLCQCIRLLRMLRNETITSMACKLHMANESMYAKIQRGEYAKLDVLLLHQIAEILGVSVYHLCRLAGLDLLQHHGSIQTLSDFVQSLQSVNPFHKEKILGVLPPPKSRSASVDI